MTRTQTALDMQAQGASNREIAQALNVSVSTAAALLASGHRAKKRGGTGAPVNAGSGRGKYEISTNQLETAVMDLWDAGQSKEAIADALDIRVESVGKILGYMREGNTERAFGPEAAARCSADLLAAIRRAHPDRCSA